MKLKENGGRGTKERYRELIVDTDDQSTLYNVWNVQRKNKILFTINTKKNAIVFMDIKEQEICWIFLSLFNNVILLLFFI